MAANTSPDRPLDTLAIDIGGTGIKASVLDATGQMEHARVRVDTPYPLSPQKLLLEIQQLISELPKFDRVSAGFPGMVRAGQILSAPHFVSPDGPGGTPAPKLVRAWQNFDLAAALKEVTGRPTKVANDADLQGAAVVVRHGLELVVTLGTGVGTALFYEGQLLPHLEFAHHPLSKRGSYNDELGEAARKKAGTKKWKRRVFETIEVLRALTFFDHCFIGGGNSIRLGTNLPDGVSVVDNSAGILGGIKLWEVTAPPPTPAPAAPRPAKAPARPAAKRTPAKVPAKRPMPVAASATGRVPVRRAMPGGASAPRPSRSSRAT
jgi:polyphosphate glucokinase